MADCAPVAIAAAVAGYLNLLQATDKFSQRFSVRWSYADFAEKLEKPPSGLASGTLVDVVPPVKPTRSMEGRIRYQHDVALRIGVRAKIAGANVAWDGSLAPDKVKVFSNLLYELLATFSPTTTNPTGNVLDDVPGAMFGSEKMPLPTIIKLWDPELLVNAQLYCGIIEVPFRLVEPTV